MNHEEHPTIKAGTTLTARSICDSEIIFTAEVVERKGKFVTVKVCGDHATRRVKVYDDGSGEFIYAMGKYSMCPVFRAK